MKSAQGGIRTHTVRKNHWILSPARLPVPPPGLINTKNILPSNNAPHFQHYTAAL